MSSSPIVESALNHIEQNLISNVTIEKSSPVNATHVNIRFTIALAVPVGKFL
jgi:hypothetical protein